MGARGSFDGKQAGCGAPTLSLSKGRFAARIAVTDSDIEAAQRLRARVFRGVDGLDCEAFDDDCVHVLVEDQLDATLVCCFRMLHLSSGVLIARSYAAQFYDLSALEGFNGPLVEMGRFCIHPDHCDADILRVAWGAMTAYVDAEGVEMLFGCASFPGTSEAPYLDALALLRARHLAPDQWRPRVKADAVFPFAKRLTGRPDLKVAQATMPPLLRTYLMMGGWVSDHAVIDHDLGTMHVFTGVEIRAVPPARARLLRSMVG